MEIQNYHHGDLKSELIQEGLKILDEEGYEGFSLRKVAKACNVSQTAPYRHFKNKDDLIIAISLQALDAFNQSLEQAVTEYPDDPKSQLKAMGVAYIQFFAENPEYLRLIFLSDVNEKVDTTAIREKIDGSCGGNQMKDGHPFATFYRAVERYKKQCKVEAMRQDELMLYCWGLVHGISVLICTKQLPFQKDYLEMASKMLWSEKFLSK